MYHIYTNIVELENHLLKPIHSYIIPAYFYTILGL